MASSEEDGGGRAFGINAGRQDDARTPDRNGRNGHGGQGGGADEVDQVEHRRIVMRAHREEARLLTILDNQLPIDQRLGSGGIWVYGKMLPSPLWKEIAKKRRLDVGSEAGGGESRGRLRGNDGTDAAPGVGDPGARIDAAGVESSPVIDRKSRPGRGTDNSGSVAAGQEGDRREAAAAAAPSAATATDESFSSAPSSGSGTPTGMGDHGARIDGAGAESSPVVDRTSRPGGDNVNSGSPTLGQEGRNKRKASTPPPSPPSNANASQEGLGDGGGATNEARSTSNGEGANNNQNTGANQGDGLPTNAPGSGDSLPGSRSDDIESAEA